MRNQRQYSKDNRGAQRAIAEFVAVARHIGTCRREEAKARRDEEAGKK